MKLTTEGSGTFHIPLSDVEPPARMVLNLKLNMLYSEITDAHFDDDVLVIVMDPSGIANANGISPEVQLHSVVYDIVADELLSVMGLRVGA